jgi:hypothetical protein
MIINILGTDYEIIRQNKTENPKLEDNNGLCEPYSKQIIIDKFEEEKQDKMVVDNLDEFIKKVIRHEIVHAFFLESGLDICSDYATNEELVDWIARQGIKIYNAWTKAGAI